MLKQLSRLMLILVCLAWTSVAHAQIRSATLTGTVTDPQKAIVPGATVVVTNEGTNVSQELVTNDAGLFTAPLLPAGTYSVTVTLSGFAPFKRSGIILNATETVRVPVELSVGTVGQTVEVSAEAPLLQTDRTSVSGAVGAEMIEALPNITQNPLAYAFLQAGAVPRAAAADTTSLNSFGIGVAGRRQFSAVGVNGGRAFTNDIQLDGLPVMGGGYNEASVVPNTEGLQEVRVISNNFSAEYGRGQSVISMSTKSGTNTFHGSGAYMLRHQGLDANTFANNAQGIPKRDFRVDDAGGSIGGPILRNKLFFFSSYHLLRNDQETTSLLTVPTALERVGNFSQTFIRDENGNPVPARIFDPFNVTQINSDLYRRAEIPNAIIPNPDPYAVRMYSYLPAAKPHAGGRLQHEQLRVDDDADRAPAQLEQSRRFQVEGPRDLRQRRHLLRRGRDAAAVWHRAVQRRAGDARRQEPVYPDRRCGRAQPHAAARRPLRAQPREHEEPQRQQGRVHRLRLVRRPRQPASVHVPARQPLRP